MVKTSTFLLLNAGVLPGVTDEKLYIISYGDPACCLYVGQCLGRDGFSITCRLGRHLGANIDGCLYQNSRSGASRQLQAMFSRLPRDVQEQFTLTLLQPSDLSNFVDLEKPEIRLKLIGAGITPSDIEANKITKPVIDFCEKALASELEPTYCKSGYCSGSSGLPEELIKHLT